MIFIIILLAVVNSSLAFIGYDCGPKSLNVTTVSLLDVGPCDIPDKKVQETDQFIQLLQINDHQETQVMHCKIEIKRHIFYCGMHSHISAVAGGYAEYIHEIDRETCNNLYHTGAYQLNYERLISGIKKNETNSFPITFAGSLGPDGACKGVYYSDPYGSWEDVTVQGLLKITVTVQKAKVNLNTNKIHLKSGTVCKYSDGTCMDQEAGRSYWTMFPADPCRFEQYSIIFRGNVAKITDTSADNPQIIYTMTRDDITFALTKKSSRSICGYDVILTEHPKLIIFETDPETYFARPPNEPMHRVDIFTYMNSKFVYVERHIRTQMARLYRDVLMQRCETERETLKNALAIATQAPDQFAYSFMKGPGYMALTAGEVVHIVKCVPVDVVIEHGKICYEELQVSRNNQSYYLTPRTHILKSQGTQVDCNRVLPSFYKVDEGWVKILPEPTETSAPTMIKPLTKPTWKYINPSSLANHGIYTQEELDKLSYQLMFPIEREAMINNMAREINGQVLDNRDGTIAKLLNERTINQIIESTWIKMWSKFMMFGTVSAGLISIFIICHVIKAFIGMILNGYIIHEVHGCSIHILGAVWSTLAHFLIYLGKERREAEHDREQASQELMQVITEREDVPSTGQPRTIQPTTEKGFFDLQGRKS